MKFNGTEIGKPQSTRLAEEKSNIHSHAFLYFFKKIVNVWDSHYNIILALTHSLITAPVTQNLS